MSKPAVSSEPAQLAAELAGRPNASSLAMGDAVPGSIAKPRLISYFVGPITKTTPRASITATQLHAVIVNPPAYLRKRVSAARAEYEANGKGIPYHELKCKLDYFTAGGTFTQRGDKFLIAESGLLVLDFDELDGRVEEVRAALLTDAALSQALVLVFISPSGDGLKAVLAADPRYSRVRNYACLRRYLTSCYGWGITLDKKTADVSRACFLSHDPTAWLAPAYAAAPAGIGRPAAQSIIR